MIIRNISKRYHTEAGEVIALNCVSYSFPETGLVTIIGKSGCGKTTLLYILAGLLEADEGKIETLGLRLDEFTERQWDDFRNLDVGIIFQDYQLFEDRSVEDNINIVLDIRNGTENKDLEINRALTYVGLGDYQRRRVSELSGGQKQRVAIARAIIKRSKYILADEPTGHLDEKNSNEIWELLKRISSDRLVIVVTHDESSAEQYGDLIISMKDGEIREVCDNSEKKNNLVVTVQNQTKMFAHYEAKELLHYLHDLCRDGKRDIVIDFQATDSRTHKKRNETQNLSEQSTATVQSIPLKRNLIYAWESIRKRKIRHAVAIFTLSLALLLAFIDITLFTFNYYDPLEEYLETYSFPYIRLGIPVEYTDSFFDEFEDVVYSGANVQSILYGEYGEDVILGVTNNAVLKKAMDNEIGGVSLIYSDDPIAGLEICGSMPQKANDIVLTDFLSNRLGINKAIGSTVYVDDICFEVCGILKTDYQEYGIIEKILDETITEIGEYKYAMEYCVAIVSPRYKETMVANTIMLSPKASDFSRTRKLSTYLESDLSYGSRDGFPCPIVCGREIENSNEILISESMAQFLGYSADDYDYIISTPSTSFFTYHDLHQDKYNNYYSGYLNLFALFPEGVKIVGIVDEMYVENCPYVLLSTSKWIELLDMWSEHYYFTEYFLMPTNQIDTFVDTMEKNSLYWDEPSVAEMSDIQASVQKLKMYMLAVFAVVLVMAFVLLINCIGFSIKDSEGKIGIMRALGIRKRETFQMFLWETVFIVLCSAFLSFVFTQGSILWANNYLMGMQMENKYNLLHINYWFMLLMYAIVLITAIIIQKIPLSEFSKRKPAELLSVSNK